MSASEQERSSHERASSPPIQPSMIRLALVDGDAWLLQTMVCALAQTTDLQVVGVAGTRAQGTDMLNLAPADVLLVDLTLPDGSGLDVIRAAKTRWPCCSAIVRTDSSDTSFLWQSIEAGALGYLLKRTPLPALFTAIRDTHAGGSPISPLILRQILTRFGQTSHAVSGVIVRKEDSPNRLALSSQERVVLSYLTQGFTFKEIARLMTISVDSVHTYVQRLYAKLHVHSKAEAIYETLTQSL